MSLRKMNLEDAEELGMNLFIPDEYDRDLEYVLTFPALAKLYLEPRGKLSQVFEIEIDTRNLKGMYDTPVVKRFISTAIKNTLREHGFNMSFKDMRANKKIDFYIDDVVFWLMEKYSGSEYDIPN